MPSEWSLNVQGVRAFSWEVFGDEDLVFFIVFLGMPAIAAVAYLCYRIYRINERLQYATQHKPSQAELEIRNEISSSADENDEMNMREILAMTAALNAQEESAHAPTLRRRKATKEKG